MQLTIGLGSVSTLLVVIVLVASIVLMLLRRLGLESGLLFLALALALLIR